MRELERDSSPELTELPRLAIVGPGRVGSSLARAADSAGLGVRLAGREDALDACREAEAALLCVPDSEIEAACEQIAPAVPPLRFAGHVSGATTLGALAPAAARGASTFSLHPLQTFPDPETAVTGTPCAVAGSDGSALLLARSLAGLLGMRAFEVPEERRDAYHAAAAIASNLLVALEESAAELLERAGIEDARELLAPLVLRTAANWAERGPTALTGPIARGDAATVERHREAIAEHAPHLAGVYDELAKRATAVHARPPRGRAMRVVRTKSEVRAALDPDRRAGKRIGLVPTMGAFHQGHVALMRAARVSCDVVVVSLFVNPGQFGPGEDLEAYPHDEERDLTLAATEGIDLVWAPQPDEVYPTGFGTAVEVDERLTGVLDGDPGQRGASHFRSVATVVAKLFNVVQPSVAFFGQKDAQQAVVIRRMAADLDFPVEIEVLPTAREPDGLAMSSRNAYLDEEERRRAVALSRGLRAAQRAADERSALGRGAAGRGRGRASQRRLGAGVSGGARRRGPDAGVGAQREAGAGGRGRPGRQGAPDRQRGGRDRGRKP